MAEPISIAAAGFGRIAPLAGKQLEAFRRRDEVKNLFRELSKELKRAKALPRGKRKRVRKKADRLRDNGEFLALLAVYIEQPRGETITEIREELSSHLRFDDPEIPDGEVLEIVVTAIERSAPRAQRDPRDAGFTNRQAVIAAFEAGQEDLKAHVSRELTAREGASAEATSARTDRLGELDREVAASKQAMGTSPFGADLDPERHLRTLAEKNPDAEGYLRAVWETSGTDGLLALIQTPESWLASAKSEVWVAIGRLLGEGGEFESAEHAFLKAAESDTDPVRQVVRAAAWAKVRGDAARAAELVRQAAELPNGGKHPAVEIAQAKESIGEPKAMLKALAGVVPANSAERAGLETLRAQGHLLLNEKKEAEEAVARALAADPTQLGAKELRGLIALLTAQDAVFDGDPLDEERVQEAAQTFAELRESLKALKRVDEAAHMGARLVQAYALLEETDQMEDAIEELIGREIPVEVAAEVARSALSVQRGDLSLRALAGSPQTSLIRMLTVVAQTQQGTVVGTRDAAQELVGFLESPDVDDADRGLASYALLSTSLKNEEIAWNPAALDTLRAEQPIPAAILEAEHLQAVGDSDGAEAALLKHGDEPVVLQRLAILASENHDLPLALKRAEALERADPSPGNVFNRAQILRQAGELKASEQKFLEVARNTAADTPIRSGAFGRAAEVAAERDDFSAGLRISEGWVTWSPDDPQAHWFKVFTLARLSRYTEALAVLEKQNLSVDSLDQAHLTAAVYHRAAPTVEALQTISGLSDQFKREDEALEAMVLFTALRRSEKDRLPEPLEKRVKEAFEAFPERFPNSRRIWTIKAPKTRDEFDAFVKDMLVNRDSLEEQAKSVEAGDSPIASLSAQAGRPVSETFLRLGVLPLGYGDSGLDELERNDASQALGAGAVWDSAALFVVGGLGSSMSATARNALPGSVVAQATLEDCDLGGTTTGDPSAEILEVGYDPKLPGAWVNSWSPADSEREHLRAGGMLELAQSLQTVPNSDPESEDPWRELLQSSTVPIALLTLPATISVAQRRGAPVFSDDRFVRLTARRAGLSAFGTTALLDALHSRGLIEESKRQLARQRLLESRAWGLCPDVDELATLASTAKWEPSAVLWRALTDRGFWLPAVMDGWRVVARFLHEVWRRAPHRLLSFVEQCLGAAVVALPQNPGIHRDALMIAALEIGVPEPRLPNGFIRDLTKALQTSRVPFDPNVRVPVSSLAVILESSRGQPGWVRVFLEAIARFPLDLQEEAITTFFEG